MAHRYRYTHRPQWDTGYSPSSSSSSSCSIRPPAKAKKRRKTKKRKMKIKIFLPNEHCVVLHVAATAFIKDIKKKIETKMDIAPMRQQLFFQGEELHDERTLMQSNFPTAIFLSILEAQIKLYIKTLSGKTVKMNANAADTIEIIKKRIENEEGIAIKHQRLLFDGKELEDGHDLSYYQITSESTLYSTLRFRSCNVDTSDIRIDIRTSFTDSRITALFVHRNTFIQEIKAMIEQKTNVLLQLEDHLIFSGQILENTRCLSDYNIYNDSTLYLRCVYDNEYDAVSSSPSCVSSSGSMLDQIPEMQETFEIYIEIPEMYHRVIQLEVESNDTIEDIKEKIEMKEVIPPQDQILTHFHKSLDDDQTLCHHNIDCESVLQLKLRGFSKFLVDKLE